MEAEQGAGFLRTDDPLLRVVVEIVAAPEPESLPTGHDSLDDHAAAEVELAGAERNDVNRVADRHTALAKAVAARQAYRLPLLLDLAGRQLRKSE
jgi:hypothetical protein